MNYTFRVYLEGWESQKIDFEVEEREIDGMTEEEKDEYIRNSIYSYVCESIEITEVEEE